MYESLGFKRCFICSGIRPPKYGNRSQGTTPYLRPTVESRFYELNETAIAIARQRERLEFFATYDVMTGVRIAATLGAFFGLMVFLIVYKSRSTSNKALQVRTFTIDLNFRKF
jgi:hypothetical protein